MAKKKDFVPDPGYNPYRVRGGPPPTQPRPSAPIPTQSRQFIDFNTQRVCPSCGKIINIDYNFCKFCGVDLSLIEPIGRADDISKQLAITAVTDPDPSVRKESLDTLGGFKDKNILGLLTYILLNDVDPEVRREAADELGDLHHPYSQNVLARALKDPSAIVRKEAIEGLKKIKEKNKPKEVEKGKDRLNELEEKEEQKEEQKEEEVVEAKESEFEDFERF